MSREDEPTPIWNQELSFERTVGDGSNAESAWAEELALWAASPEQGVEAEPTVPDPLQEVVEPETPAWSAEPDHGWLTEPVEEVSDDEVTLPERAAAAEPHRIDAAIAAASPPLEPPAEAPFELPEVLPVARSTAPLFPPPAPETPAPAENLAAAEPALEPVPKVPFYKRELSLKRTRANGASAERKPRREREPKERAETAERTPFSRRALSLRRRRTDWEPAERPDRRTRERPRLSLPSVLARGGSDTRKLVGLKIGASQIAAARVANGVSPELLQAVRAPLEEGVVVGGELRDVEALAGAIKAFFKAHNLPRRGVRLGIANNRIGVRTLDVVGIDDPKQLENAIKFRAQEVLPIPIEDAVLDYQVLSESVDEDGRLSRRVLLVVAYRDLVDRYVLACRKAGLQIVGIDLEAFALLRALAEPRSVLTHPDSGALVAVAVGHDRSTFAVSDGRVCEFTRVLQWGGWSLNVAIARALDTAPSEAEAIKRALSLAGGEQLSDAYTEAQLTAARDAARKQLQTFARELVSSLQFYQNQPGSLSIGEIVVTGGTAHLAGLDSELERLVGVPVRLGDPLGRVKVSKKVKEQAQVGSLAIAIGLGIED